MSTKTCQQNLVLSNHCLTKSWGISMMSWLRSDLNDDTKIQDRPNAAGYSSGPLGF